MQTPAGGSYFAYQEKYYLPYLEPDGNELYIMVDPPASSKPQVQVASSEGVELAERSLTVPAGTSIPIRLASELSSATSQTGQRFTAYLDDDVKVGEILAAPRGSKVYGMVAEVEQAGSMSGQSKLTLRVTEIDVNGRVLPLLPIPISCRERPSRKIPRRRSVGPQRSER